MNELSQELIARIQALQLNISDMDNFFDVVSRAEQEATAQGQELTADHVSSVLKQDVTVFMNDTLRITPSSEQDSNFDKAKKQVQLNNELRPLLSLIAAVSPNLISEINSPNQQMGAGVQNSKNNSLTHPKLDPFLDQVAASFLDAYKKIEAADNKNPKQMDEALTNANELSLQYKMVMKNSPKLSAAFKERMENKPAPGYKPTLKPSGF